MLGEISLNIFLCVMETVTNKHVSSLWLWGIMGIYEAL